MTTPVLDINDSTLGVWRGDEYSLASPGYALLEGRSYRFGESAREQARLNPRQINHRFWAQLDMEPLTPAFGPGRHSADLVHAHLQAIHEGAGRPDSLILAVPASMQHEQLALLLGIIQACPFEAVGLVDRSVAAATRFDVADYNWHVELQLNQALLTGMRLAGGKLQRDTAVPIPGSGWLALQESLARAIADAFIRQNRFDPRRSASSEQSLYNRLPGLLQQLQSAAETNLDIDGRQARIERSALAEACDKHYQRILSTVSAGNAQVLLGSTTLGLPGLREQLPGAQDCAPDAISAGVAANLDDILADETGIHLITSLTAHPAATAQDPAREPVAAPETNPRPVAEPAPEPTPAPDPDPDLDPDLDPDPVPTPEPNSPGRCQIEITGTQATIRPQPGPTLTLNGQPLQGPATLADGDLVGFADGTAWRLVAAPDTGDHGS